MGTVVGWYLIGPMEAVCLEHASTPEQARELTRAWVASVLPIYSNGDGPEDPPVCFLCGELVHKN